MGVTYNTIDNKQDHIFPVWSNTWLGSDGCGNRTLSHSATSLLGPVSSVGVYEPVIVEENKNPKPQSGKRSGFPPYRMTCYSVSKKVTRNFLLRRNDGGNGINRWFQYGAVPRIGGTCTPTISHVDSTGPLGATWTSVTHFDNSTNYIINGFDSSELYNAYMSVQNEAAIEALTTYDALTDIAEFREIPSLVRSVSSTMLSIARALRGRFDRNTLRAASNLPIRTLLRHPNRVFNRLGKEWMQYRYGIMPLVYSYRDVLKAQNRHQTYTIHKSRSIQARDLGVTLPASTVRYRWTRYVGNVYFKATVFQTFSSVGASRLAGLGFNPLVTAWELIPYSFVIDWFVNIGDYILRKTTPIQSNMCWACISRRDSYTKETYVHYPNDDKTVTFSNNLPSLWWGSSPPSNPSKTISRPEESQLLQSVETNSYVRHLFSISDARLFVKPSLNWRRLIDSAVMAVSQLGALNKRFKG